MNNRNRITVVGSLSVDQFVRVEKFPQAGETVLTDGLEISFGGKGANQAVAASRLGAEVEMIGCVGADEMGQNYVGRLRELGIGTAGVQMVEGAPTGRAFIMLDASSENMIVVVAGANSRLTAAHVEAQAETIAGAGFLLLQNEVPEEANLAAIEIARKNGAEIIYNPAPWRDGNNFDWQAVDIVVVNEIEAAQRLGQEVDSAEQLSEGMVVTRGADATLARIGGEMVAVKPRAIVPVDTVGAGDTFCGALAVSMGAAGLGVTERLEFANRAAGLSTQKVGAQGAMPTLRDLLE